MKILFDLLFGIFYMSLGLCLMAYCPGLLGIVIILVLTICIVKKQNEIGKPLPVKDFPGGRYLKHKIDVTIYTNAQDTEVSNE